MKSKKFTAIAAGLVLTAVCAVGTITAFATGGNAEVAEATAATQETVLAQQLSSETKDMSAKKDMSGKAGMGIVKKSAHPRSQANDGGLAPSSRARWPNGSAICAAEPSHQLAPEVGPAAVGRSFHAARVVFGIPRSLG